ncbi:hypothetical protein IJO12_08445, partial [bacterium]|nr:hypothetical protein [bacterium]
MGMAASQARLISLQARQANLEYHGQQINQERSILSQQVTDLYNSLLALSVPTPPSTSEYTKVQYSGIDGATPFTIGNVTPSGVNSYTVTMNVQKTGHYMQSAGQVQANPIPEEVTISQIPAPSLVTNAMQIGTHATNEEPPAELPLGAVALEHRIDGVIPTGYTGEIYAKVGDYLIKMGDADEWNEFCDKNPEAELYINYDSTTDAWTDGDLYFESGLPPANSAILGYEKNGLNGLLNGITYIYSQTRSTNGQAMLITEANITDYFEELDDGTYKLKAAYGNWSVGVYDKESTVAYDNITADNGICGMVGGNPCYTLENLDNITSTTMANYIEAIRKAWPEETMGKSDDDIKKEFGAYTYI